MSQQEDHLPEIEMNEKINDQEPAAASEQELHILVSHKMDDDVESIVKSALEWILDRIVCETDENNNIVVLPVNEAALNIMKECCEAATQ